MTPDVLSEIVIAPAFSLLRDKRFASPAAETMLHAIAWQESNLRHRRQVHGPARSWWQFEVAGVRGVLANDASVSHALRVCDALGYTPDAHILQAAMEHNDVLAACFARLLLWTDPRPLPTAEADGWNYYLRNWRPGKPHIERWASCWEKAVGAVYVH